MGRKEKRRNATVSSTLTTTTTAATSHGDKRDRGKSGGKKKGQRRPQQDRRRRRRKSSQNDEHDDGGESTSRDRVEDDRAFRSHLAKARYVVREMAVDGNCLFRSLSDRLFDDRGREHDRVREEVCDFLESHEDVFCAFVVLDDDDDDDGGRRRRDDREEYASSYDDYVGRMRRDGEWGGNPELVAAARLNR